MKSMLAKALALLFLVAMVTAACGGNAGVGPAAGGGSPTETGETEGGETPDVTGGSLSVEMDDFYFEPKTITGDAGSRLTLELENEGQAPHTFTIDEQDVDVEVEAGEDAEATVTIPESGSVQFYCRFHKSQGMVGTLTAS